VVDPENRAALRWRWTLVFVLNLALPLPVGLSLTREGGVAGILVAVFVCWAVGLAGCYHLPRAARAATDGGILVAMFQVFPVVHFVVGIGAVFIWERVAGHAAFRATGWRAELAGFGVSVLTALPLLFVAWVLGGGPGLLFAGPVARTPDEADYIESGPPAGPPAIS